MPPCTHAQKKLLSLLWLPSQWHDDLRLLRNSGIEIRIFVIAQ